MKESHERRPNRHCSRPYFSKREGRSAFEILEPRFAVVAEMVSREVYAAIGTANVVDWGRERTIRRGGRTMRRTRQTRLIVPSACGALSEDMRYPVDTSHVRRCGVRHSRVAPLSKSGVRSTRNSYATSNQKTAQRQFDINSEFLVLHTPIAPTGATRAFRLISGKWLRKIMPRPFLSERTAGGWLGGRVQSGLADVVEVTGARVEQATSVSRHIVAPFQGTATQ